MRHPTETRERQDALVIERIKKFAGNQHLDRFINDRRGDKIARFTATNMPTSHELLMMDVNEFERCQRRLVHGEYDDAPVIVEPEPEPEFVYPTEAEFMEMTVHEINVWLALPCEGDSPEKLMDAIEMAQCIRRLRVMGLLP